LYDDRVARQSDLLAPGLLALSRCGNEEAVIKRPQSVAVRRCEIVRTVGMTREDSVVCGETIVLRPHATGNGRPLGCRSVFGRLKGPKPCVNTASPHS
jgi:hypothetical protein